MMDSFFLVNVVHNNFHDRDAIFKPFFKAGDIAGLQTSKAGAAQIALMLVLANGVQVASKPKVLLVFNAAQQTALDDREKFKDELAAAVARNRASADGGSVALGSATPSTPASPAAAPSSPSIATRGATPDTRARTPVATRPSGAWRSPKAAEGMPEADGGAGAGDQTRPVRA